MRKIAFLSVLLAASSILFFSSCSPTYVIRAAYEESVILWNREDIRSVIRDDRTTLEEKRKLALVLEARDFGTQIGLNPGQSFTLYSKVDRDILAWVLLASKPDAFVLHQWWFPVVGRVPYKGFFEKEDADAEAQRLQRKGFETWVRGTEAFSTLGWFNDPVLSTTLRHPDISIVNTVLHESTHATVWIPGRVDFNESLANFVGTEASVDFYEDLAARCRHTECDIDATVPNLENFIALGKTISERQKAIAMVLDRLYQDLDTLYRGQAPTGVKLEERRRIFTAHMAALKQRYPDLQPLKEINNAELVQLKIYLTQLDEFQRLWETDDHNWGCFMSDMKEIKRIVKGDSTKDPFEAMREMAERRNPGKDRDHLSRAKS